MVRLRPTLMAWCHGSVTGVSIPLWCDCDPENFNLLQKLPLVSIPLWCDCDKLGYDAEGITILCFNPTMVRLRLKAFLQGRHAWQMKFQSHYGAIATKLREEGYNLAIVFQSHYGAIATCDCRGVGDRNSLFQSHYGAIATLSAG